MAIAAPPSTAISYGSPEAPAFLHATSLTPTSLHADLTPLTLPPKKEFNPLSYISNERGEETIRTLVYYIRRQPHVRSVTECEPPPPEAQVNPAIADRDFIIRYDESFPFDIAFGQGKSCSKRQKDFRRTVRDRLTRQRERNVAKGETVIPATSVDVQEYLLLNRIFVLDGGNGNIDPRIKQGNKIRLGKSGDDIVASYRRQLIAMLEYHTDLTPRQIGRLLSGNRPAS